MSSRSCGNVLALVILTLCLSGCGTAAQERAVRERAQKLIGHLCRGETDACMEYADPLFVRAQGAGKAKIGFAIMGGLLKLGKQTEQTVQIDEIIIGQDRKAATVRISLLADGQRKPIDPSRWVLADGQWYITF